MSKHGHKRNNEQHVHINKYANCSKAESVAARLDSELKRASNMVGREGEQENYVPYFLRTPTSRFVRYSCDEPLGYSSKGRMSQPQTPQRKIRSTTDFWQNF